MRGETKRRIGDLGSGEGFVLAPVHKTQPDVPGQKLHSYVANLTNKKRNFMVREGNFLFVERRGKNCVKNNDIFF